MIPAHGYEACFKDKHGKIYTRPVVAWSENHEALIVDDRQGKLRSVRETSNFEYLARTADDPLVGAVPGGGWMLEYDEEDGTKTRLPVVAWGIDAQGFGKPLMTNADGLVEPEGDEATLIPPAGFSWSWPTSVEMDEVELPEEQG